MATRTIARGSLWNQWDLHVHTPASFHWLGQKFGVEISSDHNRKLVDEMIDAMNRAAPAVFAIMDYWTFDGWFALKQRLAEPDAPRLLKKVLPGIELRLAAPTSCRLNAHVIFSDEIPDQQLRDFLSNLNIERINRPVSANALIDLARSTAQDMLEKKGHKKDTVAHDDADALLAGYKLAEISCESYKKAISNVPNEAAIGFMPYDTSDGLSEVKWEEHYAYFLSLFESSPIFESRNLELRSAFLCEQTAKNRSWLDSFKHGLKEIPRLVVAGSDAHCFVGVQGDNNKRGYGDFPSGKKTWIKADPSFRGLKQAILEPSRRSFIGDTPPKVQEVESNKTYYIDSIEIKKIGDKAGVGQWLDSCDIPLNPDLVAIIGNKGSGKSALADVIATLGNSKQSKHFSFLKKDRFWGKSGDPARQFSGTLTWRDTSTETRNLNELPSEEKAELVRYIPQGYFEELCNEHISGKSNAFEKELRSVIFSHTSEDMRLGALDFDQLTEQQEQALRNRLGEYRKELASINASIVRIEEQLQPIELNKLTDLLLLKTKQIEEHEKLLPVEVAAPAGTLDPAQKQAANSLTVVNERLEVVRKRVQAISTENTEFAKQQKAISNLLERLRLLRRTFDQTQLESADDLKLIGVTWAELGTLEIKTTVLDEKSLQISAKQSELKAEADKLSIELTTLAVDQQNYSSKLNAPQQQFEAYQRQLVEWNKKLAELIGSPIEPETKLGLETRITQINDLPAQLKALEVKRLDLSGEIFATLNAQRNAREELFKPVQDLIQKNSLIREDYKLQFQATLAASADAVADLLFGLIKQTSGEFRGQDDALSTIKKLFDSNDLNTKDGATSFVTELHKRIMEAAKATDSANVGIFGVVKKGQTATAVYDLIFGLNFLEPRYSLMFQDAQIEQLSPGQRGALLLIFYLLVDIGKTPIILDQPEENLDNETVFRLLVPVLSEAKKQRQIIMVTHNPNLAVVCDAEQIIYAKFDRAANSSITYESGAIENTLLNGIVVTVLEGTKPAFDNRSGKYH
ncbi:MAG: AAA family ATPase [Anaerolineales bacterium]|nr:AAA family ATPase [Anaerolineales bacterium]